MARLSQPNASSGWRNAIAAFLTAGAFLTGAAFSPTTCTCPDVRTTICEEHLQSLCAELELYALNHDHQLPGTLEELLATSPAAASALKCPSAPEQTKPYIYCGAGASLGSGKRDVLLFEPEPRHDGKAAVLFSDSRVEFHPQSLVSDLVMRAATRKVHPSTAE